MADFNQPSSTSLYTAIWSLMQSAITTVVTMFDGTSDSNIPNKAKRYNTTTDKFEKYSSSGSTWSILPFHTPIDNHIADTSLHGGIPTGGMVEYTGSTAPTNWLLCDGAAYSRTTYAALFAIIGTNFGVGDGSTTFNVPDSRGRFALGKAASGTGSTLGQTGGSLDHTHAVSNHTHAISQHTHTMANHTHSLPAHTHSTPAHEHTMPSHGHSTTHSFANISISVGGSHQHNYGAKEGGSDGSGANRSQGASSTSGSNTNYTTSTTGSTHTHAHSEFTGTVGAWDGAGTGQSGDLNLSTSGYGGGTTGSGGSGTSGTPSTNTTDTGGPTATATDGGSTTSSNNPPYLVVNRIIRT